MRPWTLLVALVLLAAPLLTPAATAQGVGTVGLSLTMTVDRTSGEATIELTVTDRGPLTELSLHMDTLAAPAGGQATLTPASAWTQDGETLIADVQAAGSVSASWQASTRNPVQSLEGTGHTSYAGEDFAVVKVSDLMPQIGFRYVGNDADRPTFETAFTVDVPAGWEVLGPWEPAGDGFRLDGLIPRGFLAAAPDLEEVELEAGEEVYRLVRVAGATEDTTTRALVASAESYLKGIYGSLPINRFMVIAPDPMFKGGLASPEGIFLHDEADASVVAHELVHAYQGFQVSREPGKAAVWLVEGAAVVHGAQLEVAADTTTKQEVVERMEERARLAQREHAVRLTDAVYGSDFEEAAYVKGAVAVVGLNDALREASDQAYTLADVLSDLSDRYAKADRGEDPGLPCMTGEAKRAKPLTTQCLIDAVGRVTGYDLRTFFSTYVTGPDVPPLGSVFPGQASLRILGTTPGEPVAMEPFTVSVALTNLDVTEVEVDAPVLVDGSEAGRLRAVLPAGDRAETEATVSPLSAGSYTLRIDGSSLELTVHEPPDLEASLEVWPDPPVADRAVTLGVVVTNQGGATATGTLRVVVDGVTRSEHGLSVAGGATSTVTSTLAPLSEGDHTLQAVGPGGEELMVATLQVVNPPEQKRAPGPVAAVVVAVMVGLGALVRAPGRS